MSFSRAFRGTYQIDAVAPAPLPTSCFLSAPCPLPATSAMNGGRRRRGRRRRYHPASDRLQPTTFQTALMCAIHHHVPSLQLRAVCTARGLV